VGLAPPTLRRPYQVAEVRASCLFSDFIRDAIEIDTNRGERGYVRASGGCEQGERGVWTPRLCYRGVSCSTGGFTPPARQELPGVYTPRSPRCQKNQENRRKIRIQIRKRIKNKKKMRRRILQYCGRVRDQSFSFSRSCS
jgi:hypothetical protein